MAPSARKKKDTTEFSCETCGKVYKTKKYFQNHVSSHTQSAPTNAEQQTDQSEIPQPTSVGEPLTEFTGCELPKDYDWDDWCELDTEEAATYFELEDEEEEARRDAEIGTLSHGSNTKAKKQTKKKGYQIKCHECPSYFLSLDSYVRHRAGHGMKAAYMKVPTLDKIVEVSPELFKQIFEDLEKCALTGGYAPFVASVASRLKVKIGSPLISVFCKTLCEGLFVKFLKKKDFLSPSQLSVAFLRDTSAFIGNISERETLQEILCDILGVKESVSDVNVFLALFMRKFSDKVLVFILRTLRMGEGDAAVPSIHERYVKSTQSTDTDDFIQNIHYVGGSNIKSVFRTAMQYNTPEWRRVVITLRLNFLVSDFSSAPPQELSAWTNTRDRGGLQKISHKALDFFVLLAKEVKILERLDGSLLNEEVFDAIGQSAPLLCLWDDLKGNLSDSESCKLLHALVSHFCYTWRNGIIGRREDKLAMSKSEKHGTGGVAFRPRLVGTSTSKEKSQCKENVKDK